MGFENLDDEINRITKEGESKEQKSNNLFNLIFQLKEEFLTKDSGTEKPVTKDDQILHLRNELKRYKNHILKLNKFIKNKEELQNKSLAELEKNLKTKHSDELSSYQEKLLEKHNQLKKIYDHYKKFKTYKQNADSKVEELECELLELKEENEELVLEFKNEKQDLLWKLEKTNLKAENLEELSSDLEERLSLLEESLEESKAENNELFKNNENLAENTENLSVKINDLYAEKDQVQAKASALEMSLNEQKRLYTELTKENEDLVKKNDSLGFQLKTQNEESHKLNSESYKIEKSLKEERDKNKDLNETNKDLEKKLIASQDKNEKDKNLIQTLNKILEDKKKEIEQIMQELSKKSSVREHDEMSIENLNREKQDLKVKIEKLETEVQGLQECIANKESENKEIFDEKTEVVNELEKKNNAIQNMHATIDSLKESKKTSQIEIGKLRKINDEQKVELKELKANLSAIQKDNERLQEKLDRKDTDIRSSKDELINSREDYFSEIKDLESDIAILNDNLSEYKKVLNFKNKEVLKSEKKIKALTLKVEKLEDIKIKLTKEEKNNKRLKKIFLKTRNKLVTKRKDYQSIFENSSLEVTKIEEIRNENRELNQKVKEQEIKNKDNLLKISSLQEMIETTSNKFNSEKNELLLMNKKMTDNLEEIKADLQSQINENHELQLENERLLDQMKASKDFNNEHIDFFAGYESELKELNEKIKDLNTKLKFRDEEIDQKNQRLSELQRKADDLDSMKESLEKQKTKVLRAFEIVRNVRQKSFQKTARIEQLCETQNELIEQNSFLLDESSHLNVKMTEMEKQKHSYTEKIAALENDIKSCDGHIYTLKQEFNREVNELKDELRLTNQERESLELKLVDLKTKNLDLLKERAGQTEKPSE